ncbi:conserved hypothetical protein, steroid delta-isomerase-related [Streptomyces sp. 2231.1]|uniref:nuclear transport factor 2 family protein n=1 Tax=Streptomyces sp. 2231.1 TaxID=1855347 RepID=UPI0008944F0F|nr:nuclear transport factor 2 family protein [Streptomyces sp. 2231.1]SEE67466.1 conserved hypothetical protein, steroid delta-isomerase-related [Streptomyces sp. 2231.1]
METAVPASSAPYLEFLDAISTRDLDRVMTCYTSDVLYEEPAFHQRLHGSDEVRQSYAELFERMEIALACVDTFTNGAKDRAVVCWRMEGTVRGASPGLFTPEHIGRPFALQGVSILHLTPDNRIARYLVYWNLQDLIKQVNEGR